MCFDYDETCEHYRETIRRARTSKKCDGCWGRILVGDLYVDTKLKFEGEWGKLKHCGSCDEFRDRIRVQEIAEGCPPTTATIAIEDIHDYRIEAAKQPPFPTVDEGQATLSRKKSSLKKVPQ